MVSDQWCLNYATVMHNLTQRSLVLGLKADCLHNIRWSFENTVLFQFNDTSGFRKITMQESSDIAQPREKFPMPAMTQVCYWCLRKRNKKARDEILALRKSMGWVLFVCYPLPQGQQPAQFLCWRRVLCFSRQQHWEVYQAGFLWTSHP